MLFKKKKTEQERVKTPHQKAHEFMQSAKAFEQSEIDMIKRSEKRAWNITIVSAISALLAITAVTLLTPLKSVEPFIVRVDNNTGLTDVVSTLKHQTVENDEVINKYWLSQYIKYRESYDWETIQATYDATNLLSSPTVQAQFNDLYNNDSAPHKVLQNMYRVVIKIKAISFIGDVAQVRFEKQLIPTNPQSGNSSGKPQQMIATISFTYENAPKDEASRLINPLGFQVTSYRVDSERL